MISPPNFNSGLAKLKRKLVATKVPTHLMFFLGNAFLAFLEASKSPKPQFPPWAICQIGKGYQCDPVGQGDPIVRWASSGVQGRSTWEGAIQLGADDVSVPLGSTELYPTIHIYNKNPKTMWAKHCQDRRTPNAMNCETMHINPTIDETRRTHVLPQVVHSSKFNTFGRTCSI